jgi:hypothetical protein
MRTDGLMPRVGHGSDHLPWLSRDWLDIDCQAIGCKFNINKKCMTPSICKISPEGRCEGFTPKPLAAKIDGD